MNNWTEVSEPNLVANFRTLQGAAGPATELLAVVKANAYGHGAVPCSLALVRAGAAWLGATCVSEAVRIRVALVEASLDARILVMCGFFAEEVPALVEYALTPVLWTLAQVGSLAPHRLPIHLEVDTGMSRQGVPLRELPQLLDAIAASNLTLEGLLTHFVSSEVHASPLTALQQTRFAEAVSQAAKLYPALLHAGASSTLDNPAEPAGWLTELAASVGARALLRPGIALYGYTMATPKPGIRGVLLPVLTWKARVLSVRSLAPGETVGYNATFTAQAPMRVALLPVGFADGLRRELASTNDRAGGWVMLHGRRAPILGRISMNLTVIDVTDIPAAAADDIATVLGPGITADDHAELAKTTPYEILCGIHPCG